VLKARDKKTGGFLGGMVLLHWKKFDETTPYNQGSVAGTFTRVADARQADRVARAIDALSANSRSRNQDTGPNRRPQQAG